MPALTKTPALLLSLLLAVALTVTAFLMREESASAQASDPVVVAFGDSLTLGIGATSGNDWVSVVSRWSGINIINEGVSGNTTAQALARLNQDVLSRNPDIVIVFLGGNDILNRVPRDQTFANLGTIIDQIKASGAQVLLVGEHGEFFVFDREAEFQLLAAEKGVRYVPNALEGILGDPRDLSDAVHPNDRGYRTIAERIWEEFQDTLNDTVSGAPLAVFCEPVEDTAFVNEEVRWQAFAWGGANPGNYGFTWDGTNGLSGTGETIEKRYETRGAKSASVEVRSGGDMRRVNCTGTVTVVTEPLVGLCEVSIQVLPGFNTGTGTTPTNFVEISWHAKADGGARDDNGDADYSFAWSGTDNLTGSSSRVRQTYASPGVKQAAVTIAAGEDDINLNCEAELTNEMFTNAERPLSASCSVSPGSFSIKDPVSFTAVGIGDGQPSYEWSGTNNLTGSSSFITFTYPNPGTKTATVEVSDSEDSADVSCQIEIAESRIGGRGGGTGCFIATAAFGSPLAEEVVVLRAFRDDVLAKHELGQKFIGTYYAYSPAIADRIEDSPILKSMARGVLYPIVAAVKVVEMVR